MTWRPQIIPEFREIHFGVWEGLSFTEIAARYPAELEARFRDLTSFRIPGGESLLDVSSRVLPRLSEYHYYITRSLARRMRSQIIPEFREIHFGVWEGLSFTEIAARYPAELEARFRDLTSFRIPGGESLLDVSSRVLPRLNDLIAQHLEEAIIIVAHAGVNRVILSEALGLPLDHLFRLDQNYGCLNVIDYFPDMAVVRLLNGGVNGVAAG